MTDDAANIGTWILSATAVAGFIVVVLRMRSFAFADAEKRFASRSSVERMNPRLINVEKNIEDFSRRLGRKLDKSHSELTDAIVRGHERTDRCIAEVSKLTGAIEQMNRQRPQ